MKAASSPLLALFTSGQDFEQFDLYTITLSSGLVLRYANCPFDVVFGGNTWLCARSPGGIMIDEAGDNGPRAHWTMGFDTGSWAFSILPRQTDTLGSLPWLPAVRAGILQESTVRIDRGYVVSWPSPPTLKLVPVGLVNVFFGRTAPIDFGRSSVQININDPRELLDTSMPRNLYTAQCRYALFDRQCALDKNTFAVHVAVTALGTSTQNFKTNASASFADNYFTLGNAVFNSGLNTNLRLMITNSKSAGGAIELAQPMPYTIAIGDTLTIYPGCDKMPVTCNVKFANLVNYGGFALIPAAETVF